MGGHRRNADRRDDATVIRSAHAGCWANGKPPGRHPGDGGSNPPHPALNPISVARRQPPRLFFRQGDDLELHRSPPSRTRRPGALVYPRRVTEQPDDDRVSLDPLTPEQALAALLKVDPDDEPVDHDGDADGSDNESDDSSDHS
jgi:hypothetical protein